jgi:Methyltransferase domain
MATGGDSISQTVRCRLCGAESVEKFRLKGLQGVVLCYFECIGCGSLQTQEPTWLNDAYARSNLSDGDTGAAQRVSINQAFVLVAARLFTLHRILDFGGGDGLLCRLLRDRGLDAHAIDDYGACTYAQSYKGSLGPGYDLITAFEVFEHLPNPAVSLASIFGAKPRFIIASTELYSGQDHTWWYLAPSHGQHVFFYTRGALQSLAQSYAYSYYEISGRHVFTREPLTWFAQRAVTQLTSSILFRLFRATLPFSETWTWIVRDHNAITKGN